MINEKNVFLVSDGGSTRRSVSTFLSEKYVCEHFVKTSTNMWNDRMSRIWWRCDCTGRFQQNHVNKFRYPYIQLVVSLIYPMDVNNLTEKLTDGVSPLQNICTNFDISTLENPTETSFYKWYYISELSKLTSLNSLYNW